MTSPNQYIVDCLKKLSKEIAQLREKLTQGKSSQSDNQNEFFVNCIAAQDNSNEETYDTNHMIRARINLPKPITVKNDTPKQNKKWYKDRKFILQLFGVLAAIVYAFIAYRQWQDAHNNFVLDERAFVGVKDVVAKSWIVGSNGVVTINLVNSGKTPATNVRFRVELGGVFPPDKLNEKDFNSSDQPNDSLAGIIMPNSFANRSIDTKLPLTQERLSNIASGKELIHIWGIIRYDDIFRNPHETKFCFVMLPNMIYFTNCDVHNTSQ